MTDPVNQDSIRTLEALGGRQDADSKRQVAREFEALLVGEMTKIASKPLFGESVLGGGSAGRMWQELYMEQVVRAGAGRFGIVDSVLASMPGGDDVQEPSADEERKTGSREEKP